MHLRRALLLFAIVLGLAALAASLSRPREERSAPPEPAPPQSTPQAAPGPSASAPARITFDAARPRLRRTLEAGRAATVIVRVEHAGLVELSGLGLSDPAEPLSPAELDVLANDPGTYPVVFSLAGSGKPRKIGKLIVRGARSKGST